MKKFIRTIPGKTILFCACILSACLLAASLIGAGLMLSNDAWIYRHTEKELEKEIIGGELRTELQLYVWQVVGTTDGNPDAGVWAAEVVDGDDQVIARSGEAPEEGEWAYEFVYGVLRNAKGQITDMYASDGALESDGEYYTVHLYWNEYADAEYGLKIHLLRILYGLRYAIYAIALAAVACAIASFVALMSAAGRKPNSEEIYPGPLNRVPYDVLLVLFVASAIAALWQSDILFYYVEYWHFGAIAIWAVIESCLLLGLCMSLASRLKQGHFLEQLLLWRLLVLAGRLLLALWHLVCGLGCRIGRLFAMLEKIPLVWKGACAFLVLAQFDFLTYILFYYRVDIMLVLFLLEKAILFFLLLRFLLNLRKLKEGGERLAAGDLTYQLDTAELRGDLKAHGENLNSIAGGMSLAVEKRMKSERMKTELITNVSHDLKTPLTSIINYAGLIAAEPCDNQAITEYANVLVRQSDRLKRLIEDLVEASKAQTGNLDVELAPCGAEIFLQQAAGEYEDKLSQAGLTLVTKEPEQSIRIMADGRRMWRIFDNLMNNICKYAQSGTRVYLSLAREEDKAVITFRNTSREALDMDEEELMERFTRGDASRTTEGNGLGLAIARSMAELQGGTLHIAIDGDLFKAILTFPVTGDGSSVSRSVPLSPDRGQLP